MKLLGLTMAAALLSLASAARSALQVHQVRATLTRDDLDKMTVGNSVPIHNGTLSRCQPLTLEYFRRNAPYVSVHFKHFALVEGDSLTLSSRTHADVLDITAPAGVTTFSSGRIPGPTAVLTFTPSGCSMLLAQDHEEEEGATLPDDFGFEIDALEYTFARTVSKEDVCGAANQNEAAMCFRDREGVAPEVYESSKAVARLMQSSAAGPQTSCTGWLLGTAGHLMTNHHCIKDADEANRTNFEFMAQSPACDTACRELGDCAEFGTQESVGADFIYANEKYDYAIVRLRRKSCVLNGKYGGLSLRRAPPVEKEPIYMVQHPKGGAKVITYRQDIDNEDDDPTTGSSGTMPAEVALVNDENNLGDFWTSYYADTESGSSGSPVISRDSHLVIALHSNGACKNSGAPSHLIIEDILANNIELPDDAFA